MLNLTEAQFHFLAEILEGTGEDAARFRVAHEDSLGALDELERRRYGRPRHPKRIMNLGFSTRPRCSPVTLRSRVDDLVVQFFISI
jgi:hypothetical protein